MELQRVKVCQALAAAAVLARVAQLLGHQLDPELQAAAAALRLLSV